MMTGNVLVIFFCIKGLILMLGCAQDFSRDKENKRAYNEKRRENRKNKRVFSRKEANDCKKNERVFNLSKVS